MTEDVDDIFFFFSRQCQMKMSYNTEHAFCCNTTSSLVINKQAFKYYFSFIRQGKTMNTRAHLSKNLFHPFDGHFTTAFNVTYY